MKNDTKTKYCKLNIGIQEAVLLNLYFAPAMCGFVFIQIKCNCKSYSSDQAICKSSQRLRNGQKRTGGLNVQHQVNTGSNVRVLSVSNRKNGSSILLQEATSKTCKERKYTLSSQYNVWSEGKATNS